MTSRGGAVNIWVLVFAVLFSRTSLSAATESARDLVRFITYQSDRQGKAEMMSGLLGCGYIREDRAAALSLVGIGSSAVPDIEVALGSIEAEGRRSTSVFNAAWLMDAYAEIRGSEAFPRLRRMLEDPGLRFLAPDIDEGVAASLQLTSYVSSSRAPSRAFNCRREQEPKDALDLFIISWERNDRRWLEASLGPRAREVLSHTNWDALRAEFAPKAGGSIVSLGYRFDVSGRWSEPDDLHIEDAPEGTKRAGDRPVIRTSFRDVAGKECGTLEIRFLEVPGAVRQGPAFLNYLIDEDDLTPILRLISSCAASYGHQ